MTDDIYDLVQKRREHHGEENEADRDKAWRAFDQLREHVGDEVMEVIMMATGSAALAPDRSPVAIHACAFNELLGFITHLAEEGRMLKRDNAALEARLASLQAIVDNAPLDGESTR